MIWKQDKKFVHWWRITRKTENQRIADDLVEDVEVIRKIVEELET